MKFLTHYLLPILGAIVAIPILAILPMVFFYIVLVLPLTGLEYLFEFIGIDEERADLYSVITYFIFLGIWIYTANVITRYWRYQQSKKQFQDILDKSLPYPGRHQNYIEEAHRDLQRVICPVPILRKIIWGSR